MNKTLAAIVIAFGTLLFCADAAMAAPHHHHRHHHRHHVHH
jgi:hypothetical protein